MIALRDITCGYPGKPAVLSGFSWDIPNKGCVGIIGASGSGKTTLLKLLLGRFVPARGTISGLQDKRISVVFQEDRLLWHLSAAENVALVNDEKDPLPRLLDMELKDAANMPVSALSGGMQRRVAIARALHYGGDILLLDEPLKGLDDALKERLIPIIKAAFPLVIVVLHERHEAEAFGCDTVISL